MDEVWPGVAVSDASLSTAIRELRQVLGDDGSQQRFIETLRNRGYRLTPPVDEPASSATQPVEDGDDADPARFDLLTRLGRRLFQSGSHEDARAAHREVAHVARRDGDDARFVQAALDFAGDLAHSATGAHQSECVELLEEALSRGGACPPGLRARVRARLALNIARSRRDEAVALAQEADVLAREACDPGTLAEVLHDVFMVLWSPDNLAARQRMAVEMIDAAERAGDVATAGFGYQLQAVSCLEAGERAAAEAASVAAFERFSRGQHVGLREWSACWEACTALLDGRFVEAERHAAEALGYGLEMDSANAPMIHAVQIAFLRLDQGRVAELEPFLERLAGPRASLGIGAALVRYEAGDIEAARAELETRVAALDAVPRDSDWLSAMTMLAELASRLGDAARAGTLHDALRPHVTQCVVMGIRTACRGSMALYAGMLARTAGRDEWVVPHFELAVKTNARLRALPLLARAQLELAEALLDRDAPGDRERARVVLSECAELHRGIGLPPGEQRVSTLLARL